MTTPVRCPRCGSRGPIYAYRRVIEWRTLVDGDGDVTTDQWTFADHGHGEPWLQCGSCSHTWTTKRTDINP